MRLKGNECFRFIADRRSLLKLACRRKEQAFRPGTVANQDSLAVLYVAFSIHFQFRPFPADARTLLCFAEFTLRSFTATKSVTNALSAVKRVHLDLGVEVTAFEATALTRWKRALPLTVRWVPRQVTEACGLSN